MRYVYRFLVSEDGEIGFFDDLTLNNGFNTWLNVKSKEEAAKQFGEFIESSEQGHWRDYEGGGYLYYVMWDGERAI